MISLQRHELDGSSRLVNIFRRSHRLHYLHTCAIFLGLSPTDISISRVDFSSDGPSRTRRVVTSRQHFQVSSLPPLFQKTISCYLTSKNITTQLPLDGSSSPKSRPDTIPVYLRTVDFDNVNYLMSKTDIDQQCNDYIILVTRVLLEFFPALEPLRDSFPSHISHRLILHRM